MGSFVVGIHRDCVRLDSGGNESYSEKWEGFLQGRGVEVRRVNLKSSDLSTEVAGCNGIMWRFLHSPDDKQVAQRVLPVIEHVMGIPVFPNWRTAWHFDDKIGQYYLLAALGAPVIPTSVFYSHKEATEWLAQATLPLVAKLPVGAGATNVFRVDTPRDAKGWLDKVFRRGVFPVVRTAVGQSRKNRINRTLRRLARRWVDALAFASMGLYPRLPSWQWQPQKNVVLFQEFLAGNAFDTRVNVIGDRLFAFRRYNREDDFRASGSGRMDYEPDKVDRQCLTIARDVSHSGGFQCMAYDFLYGAAGEPRIGEISYAFQDEAVYNCPGHWDLNLNWVPGRMWPEEAQVDLFLKQLQ